MKIDGMAINGKGGITFQITCELCCLLVKAWPSTTTKYATSCTDRIL